MNRVEEKLKSVVLVGKALEIGFGKWKIKRVLVKCFKSQNLNYSNFRELLEALTRTGASEKEDNREVLTPSEALKPLRNCGLCKRFETSKINVLFLLCGHLICCLSCSTKLGKCLLCRKQID